MDGFKLENHVVSNYSAPITMYHHQSLANYPTYQHHSHPLGFYGSKYEATGTEEVPPTMQPAAFVAKTENQPQQKQNQTPAAAPRKQMRNKYTKEQKNALEKSYLNDGAYVSVRQREVMASELQLTTKQVKVWYQNRRQKDKRRDQKLKRHFEQQAQQQQQQQHYGSQHVPVIKVPLSADSPDSGVQDVADDHRELLIMGKGRELVYHEVATVSNKVETPSKTTSPAKQLPTAGIHDQLKYQESNAQHFYSLSSHYAPSATAVGSSAAQFDYSQAFASYYNNYDYRGAYHQYYQQLMSGYQSQQLYATAADPQESQPYSGY